MARLGNNGTGKTDYYGLIGRLLATAYTGQVLEGLNVTAQTSADMTVKVNPGMGLIPYGTSPTNQAYQVILDTVGGFNVTITTANGSNPRRDLIIAYYKSSVVDTTNPNNPNALVFLAVAGTPASSPADPNGSAITAAITANGGSGSDPYIILARVVVGTSVTQIVTGNITDLRTLAAPAYTTPIPTNGIAADKLATNAITLGYAQITSTFTVASSSPTQVTGLSVTVTIPAGSRRIRISAVHRSVYNNTANGYIVVSIWDGAVGSSTQLALGQFQSTISNQTGQALATAVVSPAAGSKTYNIGLQTYGAGTCGMESGAGYPAYILVEAI